jgi:uncharacterized membrane protein YuzA (DUF378 family)
MDYTKPEVLEKYSFLWSEARLVIASVALFLGGIPPVLAFNPISAMYGVVSSLLTVCWLISGLASAYMIYRWNDKKMVFGGNDNKDMAAFWISSVSGINLGLTGLIGNNIGMSFSSNYTVFIIVGLLYLASAYHLYTRWNSHGKKIF